MNANSLRRKPAARRAQGNSAPEKIFQIQPLS